MRKLVLAEASVSKTALYDRLLLSRRSNKIRKSKKTIE